jgi:hypothetical protein
MGFGDAWHCETIVRLDQSRTTPLADGRWSDWNL